MSDETEVRAIIENWAKAVSEGDRAGILARHATDMLMFDFPATVQGLEDYDRTWDFFFADPLGPITFTPSDLMIVAGSDVAFASCTMHCDGTSAGPVDFRLTTGLRKTGGGWMIVHEHHSVPTKDDRLIEPVAQ